MWMILFIIMAVVIYMVVQNTRNADLEASLRETPMDILKKRYAKGEISKEEFDSIKKDIEDPRDLVTAHKE